MAVAQKVIGGRTYSLGRASATQQLDLQLSLVRVGAQELATLDFGAVLRSLDAVKQSRSTAGAEGLVSDLLDRVGAVAQKLTHRELVRLMELVFQHVSCDGVTITSIDEIFVDRPVDLWLAFLEALKVNLGPLVAGLPLGSGVPTATTQTTTTT
jgi:hypothetical protein